MSHAEDLNKQIFKAILKFAVVIYKDFSVYLSRAQSNNY